MYLYFSRAVVIYKTFFFQETVSTDQLRNPGVGCRSQTSTQVVPLRAISADAVRENRNIRMEQLCNSEWEGAERTDPLYRESQHDQFTCQE